MITVKLAIFGALLGTGLFVGGFVYHDVRFSEFREAEAVRVSPNGYVMFESSYQEEYAYAIGMAGAVILTLSVKHILDSRKQSTTSKYDQAYSKFRKGGYNQESHLALGPNTSLSRHQHVI